MKGCDGSFRDFPLVQKQSGCHKPSTTMSYHAKNKPFRQKIDSTFSFIRKSSVTLPAEWFLLTFWPPPQPSSSQQEGYPGVIPIVVGGGALFVGRSVDGRITFAEETTTNSTSASNPEECHWWKADKITTEMAKTATATEAVATRRFHIFMGQLLVSTGGAAIFSPGNTLTAAADAVVMVVTQARIFLVPSSRELLCKRIPTCLTEQ